MYEKGLVVVAVAYSVLHHLGLVPGGFGRGPSQTRWSDWLDLALPWLILGPAALALHAGRAEIRTWATFGIGCVAYASGHGIHLAANSVANADPGPTAHLWDEVVGHYVWYLGVAVVIASIARTMVGRPPATRWGHLLAVGVGLTWATNAVGAGTKVFGLIAATTAVAFGWRHRRHLAGVMWTGSAPAIVVLLIAGSAA